MTWIFVQPRSTGSLWYHPEVHPVEALWTRILGVSLILLGLFLFVSHSISYTTREQIGHTALKIKKRQWQSRGLSPRPSSPLASRR
jgi:hypothetical protein